MPSAEIGRIEPDAVYSPRQLAHVMGVGPQTIYAAIKKGSLKAAVVSDRRDLKITGRWAREFLETRSLTVNRTYGEIPAENA
jgi:hypothetical protein